MKNKRQVCPDCRAITCTKCQLPWEEAHEDISCDQFKEWKEANDPDNQAKGLEKHLDEHGIQVRLTQLKALPLSRFISVLFNIPLAKKKQCMRLTGVLLDLELVLEKNPN